MPDLKAVSGGGSAADKAPDAAPRKGARDPKVATGLEETLSALLDGEAQDLELRRLLREVEDNDHLTERWHRYHLARGALHGEPLIDAAGFTARVSAAIDAEPDQGSRSGGLRRAFGSFAVAASVTVAVVLGGQQLGLTTTDADPAIARVAPLPVGVVNTTGAIPVRASFGTGAVPTLRPVDHTAYQELARQRLRLYCEDHAENAALSTPQGMLSFARVPVTEE